MYCMTILPPQTTAITVKLTESDSATIHARALAAHLSLSEYVRRASLGTLAPQNAPQAPVAAPVAPSIVSPLARRYLVSSSDGDDAA